MNDLEKWNKVLNFYKTTWGYPPKIVDYLACRNIIKEHCKGVCISRIANRTYSKERDVRTTLFYYMGFDGWEIDLDFSPLAVYNDNKDKELYMEYILYNINTLYSKYLLDLSYTSCVKFYKMEKLLNGYD